MEGGTTRDRSLTSSLRGDILPLPASTAPARRRGGPRFPDDARRRAPYDRVVSSEPPAPAISRSVAPAAPIGSPIASRSSEPPAPPAPPAPAAPPAPLSVPAWLAVLAPLAPDVVAPFLALAEERPLEVRREVRARAGRGTAERIATQLEALTGAYAAHLDTLPHAAFAAPGGEHEWTVAEALGHAFDARAGLATAAALAARGRFPADAPAVIPGTPGSAAATRDELVAHLRRSARHVARAARIIAGHETDPCPLEHPLVGRLRCGEWLLFAGVHDLMHLEQLAALACVPEGCRSREAVRR